MKRLLLLLPLLCSVRADNLPPLKPGPGSGYISADPIATTVGNLSIAVGHSAIVINMETGRVDLPKDMTLPDAAVAFWLRVAQAFPECRRAMLTGDPTPPTIEWRPNGMPFITAGTLNGKTYELGLRSDGVVVWREAK